ncbi:hypothetical protein L208DRAFT_1118010, partial [Tricholoma matsutake]
FCKAYGLKEHCWHGEAGSVDLKAVKEEQKCLSMILKTYSPRDQWNIDESSLFMFAPPDCGLALKVKQMAGKKKEKFCITIAFACNANGSEHLPLIYIGKAKRPRC